MKKIILYIVLLIIFFSGHGITFDNTSINLSNKDLYVNFDISNSSYTDCKIFIMAGQSNMAGYGKFADLPENLVYIPENVNIYSISLDGSLSLFNDQFGPEFRMAQMLGEVMTNTCLVFIKYAVGGSSMMDWDPDWTQEKADITGNSDFGPLYLKLLSFVEDVLKNLKTTYTIEAFFWMQGEADSKFEITAKNYQENFIKFIENVREDFNRYDLPVILGQINPPMLLYPYRDIVRNAQASTANLIPNVLLVYTDDLPKKNDLIHYNTDGQLRLGTRFVEGYLSIFDF
jgi:hypothetical protein